jgi:hypothetical protein
MDKLTFINFIRYPVLYWLVLQLVQYLYKYGFHFVSPDWKFIESAIAQLIVLIAIYLANFATSKKAEK